jgi:sugar fermentation stimulation protein A
VKFKTKLLEGVLLQRYKRFFADVEYNDEKITIHVPNTGSMKGIIDKSVKQKCWFSLHGDESKKLKGTLEAVQAPEGTWVGINTSNPNRVVTEAIQAGIQSGQGHLKHWSDYPNYKPEFKISKESRLDGVFYFAPDDLQNEKAIKHFIEIKNTTYVEKRGSQLVAMFPDSVTERGQKHIEEMMKLIQNGHKAELVFAIQRDDVQAFAPADELDPEYARLLREAISLGLIVSPIVVSIDQNEVVLTKKVLPVILNAK